MPQGDAGEYCTCKMATKGLVVLHAGRRLPLLCVQLPQFDLVVIAG